ncbi:MAG TPA: hypothetical protein VFP18_03925 [Candidatus Binatia bacterium]|nr:hypothetical protein [Candidatus Binatia bacterium]
MHVQSRIQIERILAWGTGAVVHLKLPLGIGKKDDAGRNGPRDIAVNTDSVPGAIQVIAYRVVAERFSRAIEILSGAN